MVYFIKFIKIYGLLDEIMVLILRINEELIFIYLVLVK